MAAKGVEEEEEAVVEGFDFASDGVGEGKVEGVERDGGSVVQSRGGEPG